jgi:uncharacterized protein DUF1353
MEEHRGSINLRFKGMPSIQLESYLPGHNAGVLERLSIATGRRRFTLKDDWSIELNDIGYENELNGTIVIPRSDKNFNPNVFDGASIPVPWLVSLLTIGILRPLGVTLVGSIVHDYAYKYGYLKVKKNSSEIKNVEIDRHKADKLFRDIIGTVNRLPIVGYIAWLAVRIGWLWVPYSGKRYTGRIPYFEYAFVVVILAAILLFGHEFGYKLIGIIFLGFYCMFYIASLFLQKRYASKF